MKKVAVLYPTFRVRCGRFDGSWVSSSRGLVVCPGTWIKVWRYESGGPTRQTPVPWRGFTSMPGGRHMPASCRPGTWIASRTGRGNRGGRRYSQKARLGTTWLRRPAQARGRRSGAGRQSELPRGTLRHLPPGRVSAARCRSSSCGSCCPPACRGRNRFDVGVGAEGQPSRLQVLRIAWS